MQNNRIFDLIVIGGGPSGMMCAGRAAELGKRVLLIEKNKDLGKKLSLTGGGRCNITNAEFDTRAFLANFPESKEFLFSPFSKFSVQDTFDFFEKKGLPLVVEGRKRAFPKTQSANDVVAVMENYIKKNNVEIKSGMKVTGLKKNEDGTFLVQTKSEENFIGKKVALASGIGGEGLTILEKLGHTVKEPNPNLVPLTTNAKWVHALSGISLSFMTIRFRQNPSIGSGQAKTVLKKTGKILFTHFGISGPLVLNASFGVKKLLEKGSVTASIDMFPDTEENELDRRVWRLFEKNKNKILKNILPEMMEKSLAEQILNLPDIQLAEKEANAVTKEERKALVKKMKDLSFPITGTLGFEKALIADGGVTLTEVNFTNMTSKIHPNLYLLGDVLDINRPSGGFSLQLCWTTGWVAGSDIGK
ncbi:MAG: NAD(P)/FAD-dependent oxidoreductase [Candidatus Parcubacteria bacterium]|nr:NAD(P)/FAD-dependent oxidoreductase [Candidatus Parcubacteria bacterium]